MDKCGGCGENAHLWDTGGAGEGKVECDKCGAVQDLMLTISVGGGEKVRFKINEWYTLQHSVLGMFDAVASADKNVTQEEMNRFFAILQAFKEEVDDQLLKDLVGNILNDFQNIGARYRGDSRNIKGMIAESMAIMNSKAPKMSALSYREAMKYLGRKVAEVEGTLLEGATYQSFARQLDEGIQ